MKADSSTFMLIFRETTPERYEEMTLEERRMHLDRWNGWCDQLAGEGKLQAGHPLAPEGREISASRGRRAIDGPFAEAKEMVGGYFLIDAADLDDATAIAEQCPLLRFGMTVEVRPVAGGCHLARSLGWETMREPSAL
jgi:hypothetical protein